MPSSPPFPPLHWARHPVFSAWREIASVSANCVSPSERENDRSSDVGPGNLARCIADVPMIALPRPFFRSRRATPPPTRCTENAASARRARSSVAMPRCSRARARARSRNHARTALRVRSRRLPTRPASFEPRSTADSRARALRGSAARPPPARAGERAGDSTRAEAPRPPARRPPRASDAARAAGASEREGRCRARRRAPAARPGRSIARVEFVASVHRCAAFRPARFHRRPARRPSMDVSSASRDRCDRCDRWIHSMDAIIDGCDRSIGESTDL